MLEALVVVYLFLAMRVRVCLIIAFSNGSGSISLIADMGLVQLRYDGMIAQDGMHVKILPRHASSPKRWKKNKPKVGRWAKRCLITALRVSRMDAFLLHANIGLDDAAHTAVVSGALRSAASALLASRLPAVPKDVRITPDFSHPGMAVQLQGIFSCPAGDIILAVMKAAVSKTQKEGFLWKSTPLRA
ncbi:MAG: DUF2953 domain-containing protein [Clostridia bacterium]|nr:DUF2953 domain-containing protein [Clostridia bacterium]